MLLVNVQFLVAFLLAIGPRHVVSFSFSFSDLEQCGPLNITFTDAPQADLLPLSLTVIPFNSTLPLSIPIPNAAVQNAGVWISFLPYAAGTNVVLSIDNASGSTEQKVSKTFQILPSSTGNSSCLSTSTEQPRHYTIPDSFCQCESFNISYDSSVIAQPPSIRVFKPKGSSFWVNITGIPEDGVATYKMDAMGDSHIILLLDDPNGYRQTSLLNKVSGNSSSDNSCIPPSLLGTKSSGMPILSRGGVVAISTVTGSIVVIVLLLMLVYLSRERQRRRNFHTHFMYPNTTSEAKSPPPRPSRKGIPALFPSKSTILSHHGPSPESRPVSQSTFSTASEGYEWDTPSEPPKAKLVYHGRPRPKRVSLTSLDIEEILNSATFYNSKENIDASSIMTRTVQPATTPTVVLVNPPPRRNESRARQHDRWSNVPDVPSDPSARLSQSTSLCAVCQHPPGLLKTHGDVTASSGSVEDSRHVSRTLGGIVPGSWYAI